MASTAGQLHRQLCPLKTARNLYKCSSRCPALRTAFDSGVEQMLSRPASHRIRKIRALRAFATAATEGGHWNETCSDGGASPFLDTQLLSAVGLVNMEREAEYRQVVLLTSGADMRPFTLAWPPGTVIFLVGCAEEHAAGRGAAKAGCWAVPEGCLLRRVPAALKVAAQFEAALQLAGFRGDRLSVWGLQGWELDIADASALLVQVGNQAALRSFVLGELPPATLEQARCLLGDAGLIGNVMSREEAAALTENIRKHRCAEVELKNDEGRVQSPVVLDSSSESGSSSSRVRRLFTAQQQRLSLSEMGMYEEHTVAAESVDEDFFGNFS